MLMDCISEGNESYSINFSFSGDFQKVINFAMQTAETIKEK